jgi:hypothetical protein
MAKAVGMRKVTNIQHDDPKGLRIVRALVLLNVSANPDQRKGENGRVIDRQMRIQQHRREDDHPEPDTNWRVRFPDSHRVHKHGRGKQAPQRPPDPRRH